MSTARQRMILELLESSQNATVEVLAQKLEVSEATVRRDLVTLESEGLIERTWGGAVLVERVAYESFINERSKEQQPEKAAIAQAAADMVEEGDVIALDVGTTCMELAKLLCKFQRITIFTNSLLSAHILGAEASHLTTHLIGGRMRSGEFSMVGPIARENALRFHYDKYFMGASGFDPYIGPTDFNLDDVEVKQCFLKQSKKRIALIDHSKFLKISVASICQLHDLTDVITDRGASAEHQASLKTHGIQVTIAEKGDQ